jgi:NADPH oxidase
MSYVHLLWSSEGCEADGKTRYKQESDPRLAGLNTLQYSVWLSRGAGLVLTFDGTLILVPVCRTIMRFLRPKIRFIPLDENIWFHRQLAYAILVFSIIHTSAHYVK